MLLLTVQLPTPSPERLNKTVEEAVFEPNNSILNVVVVPGEVGVFEPTL